MWAKWLWTCVTHLAQLPPGKPLFLMWEISELVPVFVI